MKILEGVAHALAALPAPFALIGGRAVGVRGYPRATLDYDFLTTDPRILRRAVWSDLERAGVVVDCRRGDLDDPVAGVARLVFPDGKADVVLARWPWERDVIARAEVLQLEGVAVPVPRTADLLLLKLAAGGVIDLQDVLVLLRSGDTQALIDDVERHLGDLDADARAAWERVKEDSERLR